MPRLSPSAFARRTEVHACKEGVADLAEDVRLRLGVRDLVAPDDRLLLEHLHSEDVCAVLLSHEHHLAEATLAEHLEQVEILEAHATADILGDVDIRVVGWSGVRRGRRRGHADLIVRLRGAARSWRARRFETLG